MIIQCECGERYDAKWNSVYNSYVLHLFYKNGVETITNCLKCGRRFSKWAKEVRKEVRRNEVC